MVFFPLGLLVTAPLSTISVRALKLRVLSFADLYGVLQQLSILNSSAVHCFA